MNPGRKRSRKPREAIEASDSSSANFAVVEVPACLTWLSLAVIARRDGRQRTNMNLYGPLRTTPRGFEDRGSRVHNRPSTSTGDRSLARTFRGRPPSSGVVRDVGCHFGCQWTKETWDCCVPRFRFEPPREHKVRGQICGWPSLHKRPAMREAARYAPSVSTGR
jgi:hypothetical protein